jgi:hypothetical protein
MLKVKYFGYSVSLGFALWKGRRIRNVILRAKLSLGFGPQRALSLVGQDKTIIFV